MLKEKYIQNIKETTINIVNSKVESIRLKNDTKTSFRVYKDGYIGVSGAIGSYDEEQLEREAVSALNQKIECLWEPCGNRKEKVNRKSMVFESEKLADEVEQLLIEMTTANPDFIFSYKAILQEINVRIVNDIGLDLEYDDAVIAVALIFKEKTSTSIMDGSIEYVNRVYDRNMILNMANMTLSAYKNQVELPGAGKYPVIFIEEAMPLDKFMTDLNANMFATGSSIFTEKKGQKPFNDNFTLFQTMHPDDVFNTPFFDAEGTVNQDYRYALIENGVVKGPFSDKRTAAKYGVELTGSALAAYDGVPELGALGFRAMECEKTLKELLGGQVGIMAIIAAGGDFTPSGDFATPVQLAMLFDGEKFIGRLPELQISSNVYDMFGKDYRGVGKDKICTYSYCKCGVIDMNVSQM